VHVTTPLHVPNPLTLVSTWDGDELSLIQMHHQLRAARELDVAAGIAALDAALMHVRDAGMPIHGAGLYRVIETGERADRLASGLIERGVRVRPYPGGRLAVVPALDRVISDCAQLGDALRAVLAAL
jgi:hypothetical protein